MRLITKVVLILVLITLVYSIAKLISAKTTKQPQIAVKTWPVKLNNQSMQNNQNQAAQQTQNTLNAQQVPPTPDTPNAQGLYQADEILIDGQGKAGSNYIDITSDTPITPQNNTKAQNNNYNNNGGAYAQASVTIDHNNNTSTSVQTYAPGVPAFEVIDGN